MKRYYVTCEKSISTKKGNDDLFCVDAESKQSLKGILEGKVNTVWVSCYNNISLMSKEEAFDSFQKGVASCEGSEKNRYEYMLIQLVEDKEVIFDDNYDNSDVIQSLMKSCMNWIRYQCESKDIVKSLIEDREGR